MADLFDAKKFVLDLNAGKYDEEIHEQIRSLSTDQLQAVAETLIRMRKDRDEAARATFG
jgi:hypothetical protein